MIDGYPKFSLLLDEVPDMKCSILVDRVMPLRAPAVLVMVWKHHLLTLSNDGGRYGAKFIVLL